MTDCKNKAVRFKVNCFAFFIYICHTVNNSVCDNHIRELTREKHIAAEGFYFFSHILYNLNELVCADVRTP